MDRKRLALLRNVSLIELYIAEMYLRLNTRECRSLPGIRRSVTANQVRVRGVEMDT